jgi:D-alanine-D-alanine ligase
MSKKHVLLLCGGGSTEHEVSLVSVKHIKECLTEIPDIELTTVEIQKSGEWFTESGEKFVFDHKKYDFAIPCIHGYPGETGDLQSYFEMIGLPYLGCNSETSKMCFNKVTTKLWATALGVPNTPYIFITDSSEESVSKARKFAELHGDIVIKASSQGSSVGCYLVEKGGDPAETIKKAFSYSPFVLLEKRLKPREIEVSVYQLNGKLQISYPGEIICPSNFYSYEEKYSNGSQTTTATRAEQLTPEIVAKITEYSRKLYYGLKIRHLSRIDFFLDGEEIYLNEINTFPGLTPISMFPKMMEANGHSFKEFLSQVIRNP